MKKTNIGLRFKTEKELNNYMKNKTNNTKEEHKFLCTSCRKWIIGETEIEHYNKNHKVAGIKDLEEQIKQEKNKMNNQINEQENYKVKFECYKCGCYFWVENRNNFKCPNCEEKKNVNQY